MLVLHTMPRIGWGLLAPSPFCAKVEIYLRMSEIPYEARPTLVATSAPRKKLPWIEDEGRAVADSERILEHLRATRGDRLGEAAVPADRQQVHHLLRRTVEESLYFVLVAERWQDPAVYEVYRRDLLASMPALGRPLVAAVAHRALTRQLWEQGTGRHPLEEALARGARDVEAVASVLGEAPFFGGERPVAVDAAVWGSLANLWYVPVQGRLRGALAGHPRLVAWLERMKERYVPDA